MAIPIINDNWWVHKCDLDLEAGLALGNERKLSLLFTEETFLDLLLLLLLAANIKQQPFMQPVHFTPRYITLS